ncbi:class I SAM-dependent methyltransferase [Candidatus Woesearchaeota archaeon]|nr:class I SAM-dependent methyltransferase [Candidatus Woesearchaeota archaeon]
MNKIVESYNKFYSGEDGARFDEKSETLIRFFRRLRRLDVERFCKKGKLLDVGYGRPIDLEIFNKNGWKATGTQISETSYQVAKKKGLDVLYGELTNLKINKKFDIITFWCVLEHVKDPNAYLRKSRNLLNKNGKIIIEVQNVGSWLAKKTTKKWFNLDLDNHLYQFSKKSLTKLLEKNGFTIKRISYFSPEISPFSALQTFLNLFSKKQNLLFKMMKKEERAHPIYLLTAFLLYPLSFAFFLIFAFKKQGDMIKIYAQK